MCKNKNFILVLVLCSLPFASNVCFGDLRLNQENIEFYGKVVDQFNAPISDAMVNIGIRQSAINANDEEN